MQMFIRVFSDSQGNLQFLRKNRQTDNENLRQAEMLKYAKRSKIESGTIHY